jgi:hypothetical protein
MSSDYSSFGIVIARYGARNWSVTLNGQLLAVCVYRKGARCVAETLAHVLALVNRSAS